MKIKKQIVPGGEFSVALVIVTICLTCGVIIGAVCAAYMGGEIVAELTDYMSGNIAAYNSNKTPLELFPSTFWNIFKYPIIVFALGFTVLGIGIIPIITALRGFYISFSVGTVIKLYGMNGMKLSLALFGIQSLISVPCLLIIAAQSFISARAQMRVISGGKHVMIGSPFPRGYFISFGICSLILTLLVCAEIFVTPKVVALTAASMLK